MGTMRRTLERVAAVMGETRRQYVLASASVIAGAGVVVVALVADGRLARAGLALLLLAILVTLLDLRRRIGNIGRWVKRGTPERSRADGRIGSGGPDSGRRVDAMTRRVMAAIESGRLEAIERHDETLLALRAVSRATPSAAELVAPDRPGRLAGQPGGLLDLTDLVQRARPDVVVSVGSGPASVWIGYALRRSGGGRLIALEHDEAVAAQTTAAVGAHELDRYVDVRAAVWTDVDAGDQQVAWYDPSVLDDLARIDVLIVDARRGPDGSDVRESAFPVLAERLAEGALIVVDPGESEQPSDRIVDGWRARVDGLETAGATVSAASVLRWRPAADAPALGSR